MFNVQYFSLSKKKQEINAILGPFRETKHFLMVGGSVFAVIGNTPIPLLILATSLELF